MSSVCVCSVYVFPCLISSIWFSCVFLLFAIPRFPLCVFIVCVLVCLLLVRLCSFPASSSLRVRLRFQFCLVNFSQFKLSFHFVLFHAHYVPVCFTYHINKARPHQKLPASWVLLSISTRLLLQTWQFQRLNDTGKVVTIIPWPSELIIYENLIKINVQMFQYLYPNLEWNEIQPLCWDAWKSSITVIVIIRWLIQHLKKPWYPCTSQQQIDKHN